MTQQSLSLKAVLDRKQNVHVEVLILPKTSKIDSARAEKITHACRWAPDQTTHSCSLIWELHWSRWYVSDTLLYGTVASVAPDAANTATQSYLRATMFVIVWSRVSLTYQRIS